MTRAPHRPTSLLRALAALLAVAALAGAGLAQPAGARAPRPSTPAARPGGPLPGGLLPGGLLPGEQQATGCGSDGVCIVKGTSGRSCTGYSSQSTPPATIRVLVHGTPDSVQTVDFRTYVQSVLPNEWIPSWDGEALKAGAVAVKSYAWYWVTHYGGYYRTVADCFDVTDDTSFQVYRAGSPNTRTSAAVDASWTTAARVGGRIVQTFYRAYLTSSGEACGAAATGSSMSQYGSQACAAQGWNYARILEAYYVPLQLATARQLGTLDDFTYAQRSTPACFDGTHTWSIDDTYAPTIGFGAAGDLATVTNSGDGLARVGVFRPSTGEWFVATASGGIATRLVYGQQGDVPVQAHFDGAGAPSDDAVFRPSTGQWWVRGHNPVVFGEQGDVPVPGDYAGSGSAVPAVWRPSTGEWFAQGVLHASWGVAGDIPAPADYDGDGRTDLAVYRPSTHQFYVRGRPAVRWGLPGDVPVSGDFTGDGRADLVVYRPSTRQWWVRGVGPVTFGPVGCRPVGAAPAHN